MNVYTTENANIFVFHFYQQQKISTKLEGKLARNCMSSEQPIRSLTSLLLDAIGASEIRPHMPH